MRKALPKAKFLGFTGTPLIDSQEKQMTRAVFGEYISIYDFQRAVADARRCRSSTKTGGTSSGSWTRRSTSGSPRGSRRKGGGRSGSAQEEKLYANWPATTPS